MPIQDEQIHDECLNDEQLRFWKQKRVDI